MYIYIFIYSYIYTHIYIYIKIRHPIQSSNENGHILPRMSGNQNVCSRRFHSMISP